MPLYPSDSTIQPLQFISDGLHLQGYLHLPSRIRGPVVIGCHGLLSDSQSPKQQDLARMCSSHGLPFFRFDFRGCGTSEGQLRDGLALLPRQRDLLAAAQALRGCPEIEACQPALFGSSFGGTVVLAAAADLKASAIVVFAAPLRNSSITLRARREMSKTHPGVLPQNFQLPLFDVTPTLHHLRRVLVVHGIADTVVSPGAACEIYDRVNSPKELVLQKNGDHLMSDRQHQKQFMARTLDWLG